MGERRLFGIHAVAQASDTRGERHQERPRA
jgi:hypothetical protein